MRGKVEVYAIASDGSRRLVLEEPNLVVNGAGESIVDMLTTPSSVLGVSPRVMDTSNWRWGAMSFGPAGGSFSGNAYFFPPSGVINGVNCNHVYSPPSSCDTKRDVTSFINSIADTAVRNSRILWVSSTVSKGTEWGANGATPSSYTPPFRLPSYPDPLDQRLEEASTSYSLVSGDGTQSWGQFENRIEFDATLNTPGGTSPDPSSFYQGAYPICGAKGLGAGWASSVLVSSYVGDFQTNPALHIIDYVEDFSIGVGESRGLGKYNDTSTMDYRGFVSATYHDTAKTVLGNVLVSGSESVADGGPGSTDLVGTVSQVTVPKATVYTRISQPDVWTMNAYGGLHQIGLWSVNCLKSLQSYEAPFLWDPAGGDAATASQFRNWEGVSKMDFRLFAKKTFTQNLTANQDYGLVAGFDDPEVLEIQWTLDFRSMVER